MKLFNRFKTILIVEDDPSIAKALEAKCSHLGYRTLLATSGKDVLLIIQKERPAGVLLDLMLPDRDGMTLLETMRGQDMNYQAPVVVLTNLQGRTTLRAEAERLNATYFDKATTPIDTAVAELTGKL